MSIGVEFAPHSKYKRLAMTSKEKPAMRNIASAILFGFAFLVAPATRAAAADGVGRAAPRANEQGAVAQSPEMELQALEGTLKYFEQTHAAANDTSPTLASLGRAQTRRSAAQAELDALTAETSGVGTVHQAAPYARMVGSGRTGIAVAAPEAELHALLAWQEPNGALLLASPVERGDAVVAHPAEARVCTCMR